MSDNEPPDQQPTAVTNASDLYRATQEADNDPGLAMLDYSHAEGKLYAYGSPSQHTKDIIEEAGRFIRRTLALCPTPVADSAKWRDKKLTLELQEIQVFKHLYSTSRMSIELVTQDKRLTNAPNRTLIKGLEKALADANAQLPKGIGATLAPNSPGASPLRLHPQGYTTPQPEAGAPPGHHRGRMTTTPNEQTVILRGTVVPPVQAYTESIQIIIQET